ncbi:peptidoglycan-binding domain-containing protein [Inediibacterium massiliense]|uniref:peptidoglycan-binding domain-containing protein n=1 Tax=Inediibacterium massiliense TaxID=1658111 RepID=UPI000B2A41D8|nr:peptidoglycan-binding domain-containing protein [Inediibacterium massiliense]
MKKFLKGLVLTTCIISTTTIAMADGYYFSNSIYKKNMQHKDVQVIQQALKKDGDFNYPQITTYFGSITQNAVKKFQKKYGLKPDGIVGKNTINKMISLGLIEGTTSSNNVVSRGGVGLKTNRAEDLDWWTQVSNKIIHRGDILTIKDYQAGASFKVKVTAGTNHADVEPLTIEDTNIMKRIWGGFSWTRRPVLVYVNSRVIAASMTNMPHAGVDSKPFGQTVSGRSGGYGTGYNFDFIKGNGIDGHVDLHFKNSTRHKDNKPDPQHQNAIKMIVGK